MPKINITHEAYEALRQETRTGKFARGAFRCPDGHWEIQLEFDTIERLREARQTGESYSDTIIRLMAIMKSIVGKGLPQR